MVAGLGAKSQAWGGGRSQERAPGTKAGLGRQGWVEGAGWEAQTQITATQAFRGLPLLLPLLFHPAALPGILCTVCYSDYDTLRSQREARAEGMQSLQLTRLLICGDHHLLFIIHQLLDLCAGQSGN